MPRSSRHKSSKHSSRDAREYSDSEKESGLREKKVKGDAVSSSSGRHLKDTVSGEKQKVDLKHDVSKKSIGLDNADEFGGVVAVSSSRKRKEKVDDDRWTGGGEDIEHVVSKSETKEKEEVKGLSESRRSSRRGGNYVSGFDVEEGKKSGSKDESKHYRSERKERGEREGGSERERKSSRNEKSDKGEKMADIVTVSENLGSKGSKKLIGSSDDRGGRRSAGKADKVNSEKLIDIVSVSENTGSDGNRKHSSAAEERGGKHSIGYTDFSIQKELKNLEPERDLDRRVRRKRDGSGDGDSHHAARDPDDRRLPSREETTKSVKYKDDVHKDDGHKDEKSRDRYHEDIEKDNWRQDDKHRDNRATRDYTSGKFDDKDLRNDKKDLDLSQKKSIPHSSEYDRELDRDYDRTRVRDRDRDRSRLDHDRAREHGDRDHDRDRDRDYDRVHDRDQVDRDREYGADRYRRELRGRVGVRDHERRDRNFDHDHDNEYTLHVDEKGSRYKDERVRRRSPDGYDDFHSDKLRRGKTEMDREMSLPQKPIVDSVANINLRRSSPNSRAYVGADKFRDGIQDETKYGDSLRDSVPDQVERTPNYRSGEKRAKCDDSLTGDFSERSPNTRVSPAGLRDRSPSSMSYDRSRFSNRNTRRRSLDVDDADRRVNDPNERRDNINVTEDRQSLPPKKFSGDEYPSAESPFYHKNKSGPGSVSSHGPGPSVFRTRVDSPSFAGSYGDDNRGPGNRYRRNVDPNAGRGPGNAWNGVPNWSSPIPNGFIPFSPGPPVPHHGGFPPFMPQYPPMYGVRPSMDMSHQGIPYHLADGDRFQGQVRPMGWPNMGDGSMPHFNGWDASNGMLRDDSSMYGPGHPAQRRDMNSDMWKQNGDMNMDVISGSQKDGPTIKGSADEASSAHGFSKINASSGQSPMKEMLSTPVKGTTDKTPDSSGVDGKAKLLRAYLAKLDISMDLTDPELYDQCINLAYKGKPECVEDEMEHEFMEENAVVESEITKFTVDMKIFPAAKESIFQKAMDLYKSQSSERSFAIPDGQKINSPTPSQPEIEQTLSLTESKDGPADCDVKLEEQTLVLSEETLPITQEGVTDIDTLNSGPLQNNDIYLDDGTDAQLPVLDVEKMEEEETCPEFIPENVEKIDSSVAEEACVDAAFIPNTDADIVVDDGKDGDGDSKTVSGSLNLCNNDDDSVKVSNESESSVLSRIHDAPESTH